MEPLSDEANANVTEVPVTVPVGPEVIDVCGGWVSTRTTLGAEFGDTLPAWSVARAT